MWNLDKTDYNKSDRDKWLKDRGYDKGKHSQFKVGQVVTFYTGTNRDILAEAAIKGINNDDLYVYNDAYWFPISIDRVI
jgi:hypothetical protein